MGVLLAHQYDTRHVHREARDQRRVARDVEPLLAELVDAAEDDVLDLGSVDADAGDELSNHMRREVVGADGGESAVPLSDGATHGSNDDGVSHGGPPEVMTSTESRFILQETGRRSTAASRKRRTLTSARVFYDGWVCFAWARYRCGTASQRSVQCTTSRSSVQR